MLETIVKNQIIFYVMGIALGLGVVAKLISTITARRMVKAASQIQKSNHKLLRLIKAKFEHACMVSDKVQNVEAFVDKYIYEYKVLGLSLNSLQTFPKKMLWITGILGVFAIFESYRIEGAGELLLGYAQWTGIFVMLLLLIHFVSEEKIRVAAAKNYIVEYLENVCTHRYMKTSRMAEASEEQLEDMQEAQIPTENVARGGEVAQADRAVRAEEEMQNEETLVAIQDKEEEERKKSEQEMRIRAILEEFLA